MPKVFGPGWILVSRTTHKPVGTFGLLGTTVEVYTDETDARRVAEANARDIKRVILVAAPEGRTRATKTP
jgi:hypothetical protein